MTTAIRLENRPVPGPPSPLVIHHRVRPVAVLGLDLIFLFLNSARKDSASLALVISTRSGFSRIQNLLLVGIFGCNRSIRSNLLLIFFNIEISSLWCLTCTKSPSSEIISVSIMAVKLVPGLLDVDDVFNLLLFRPIVRQGVGAIFRRLVS